MTSKVYSYPLMNQYYTTFQHDQISTCIHSFSVIFHSLFSVTWIDPLNNLERCIILNYDILILFNNYYVSKNVNKLLKYGFKKKYARI